MAKKLIETVCTTNVDRSPLAELIGRNHLFEIGAEGEYDTISSGTMIIPFIDETDETTDWRWVDHSEIFDTEYSNDEKHELYRLAFKRGGVYNQSDRNQLEIAHITGGAILGLFSALFSKAKAAFLADGRRYITESVEKYRINGSVKEGRDQTVSRSDVIAILPVDRENYGKVKNIYAGTEYTPKIAVLSQLATGDSKSEIKKVLGQGRQAYMDIVEQMLEEVPKAVNKIVSA